MSKPLSVLSFIKASKQAFYNNNPDKYTLPTKNEGIFIMRYMKGQSDNSGLFKSFVDSTFSKMRISCQMADIGSTRMDSLVHEVIEPRMKSIFVSTEKDTIVTAITGTTKIFIKGNKFLIANLQESLLLAFYINHAVNGYPVCQCTHDHNIADTQLAGNDGDSGPYGIF